MDLVGRLDGEVQVFLEELKAVSCVEALIGGTITREAYIGLLGACYLIESYSSRAVEVAGSAVAESSPELSRRFGICAAGERGHAEVALEDLKGLGVPDGERFEIPEAREYRAFLEQEAAERPECILAHSHAFECASGELFPQVPELPFPDRFIRLHAREDPGHSVAIRRTVRMFEQTSPETMGEDLVVFARESRRRFLGVLEQL